MTFSGFFPDDYALLASMLRLRAVENEIALQYPKGEMRCPTHLSIGQEGVPAVMSLVMENKDYAVSTHRGHAHYLAKGGSLDRFIAELYGKVEGCSRGRGGSMHLIDVSAGFMGTSAIVGNSIPPGVGLALAKQTQGVDGLSFIFLGDGAVEEGVFYESVNFAAVRNLPVVFICENNLYSVYSGIKPRQPEGRSISKMVEAIGVASSSENGNDVFQIYSNLKKVVSEIKVNPKPYFFEFNTYRWLEHCGPNVDDNLGYRPPEEVNFWKNQDPIEIEKKRLILGKKWDAEIYKKITNNISSEVNKAFEFAKASPFPKRKEAFGPVYA